MGSGCCSQSEDTQPVASQPAEYDSEEDYPRTRQKVIIKTKKPVTPVYDSLTTGAFAKPDQFQSGNRPSHQNAQQGTPFFASLGT